jgi:hypothetical protein
MLTVEQVQEILNVKSPLVYSLVRNGGRLPGNVVDGASGGYGK